MMITLEDRETLKAIVMDALASFAQKPEPVPVSVEYKKMTVQQVMDMVMAYRATLRKRDKIMAQYRNHPFNSKNATSRTFAILRQVEEAEEGFLVFCRAVAAGTIQIK